MKRWIFKHKCDVMWPSMTFEAKLHLKILEPRGHKVMEYRKHEVFCET